MLAGYVEHQEQQEGPGPSGTCAAGDDECFLN